jgi:CRISPR-associated endoribonuclease Cas6
MRMQVTLRAEREIILNLNYQHALSGAVYAILERADPEHARFLHHEGYVLPEAPSDTRRFKGFVFSQLFAQNSDARDARRGLLRILPGEILWHVASPLDPFLRAFASGLLQSGELRIGDSSFAVQGIETLPAPSLEEATRFRCLSPVVASVSQAGYSVPKYLRPGDAEMSERLRQNLLHKHLALLGRAPEDESLSIEWDAKYLASRSSKKHAGTKLISYKDIRIVGVMCPFTMSGSVELMSLACEAGLGEKNSAGFGFVEVAG